MWEALEGPYRVMTVLLLVAAWCVWWLWGVNWHKLWPVLGAGGWAPVVLLMLAATLAWSRLAERPCDCAVLGTVANGWWQFWAVCGLAALALFCGWVQGYFGWAPPEYPVEPPPVTDHGHAHGHGH